MSFPDDIRLCMKDPYPKFGLKAGDLVIDTTDKNENPLVITGFLPFGAIENPRAKYIACRINSDGNLERHIFRKKELKKLES